MNLKLIRLEPTAESTIGRLYVEGQEFCWTLEDVDRFVEDDPTAKIPGKTAIPTGLYKVTLRKSPKRGIIVPWIEGVPGYEAVQIHPGNKARDTEGCLLVGLIRGTDAIFESRKAFKKLMDVLRGQEDIGISIMRDYGI